MIKTYLFCLFCLMTCLASSGQPRDSIRWLSFEQLSDALAVQPKKVLLFFHTDWCSYCHKMQQEVFTHPQVVQTLNRDYYAVRFDAESIATVHFDGQSIGNQARKKRRGAYHDMTKLLASRNGSFNFPCTLILQDDFTVEQRFFRYLGRKQLLHLLQH